MIVLRDAGTPKAVAVRRAIRDAAFSEIYVKRFDLSAHDLRLRRVVTIYKIRSGKGHRIARARETMEANLFY